MRLNKKKLAAMAMSAVMAASTIPFPVMAEELSAGDAVTTEVEAVEASDPQAKPVEVDHVVIEKDGKVTVYYKNGVEKDETTYTATITEKAATCTEPKKYIGTVTVKGVEYKQTIEEEGTKLGHDLGEKKLIVDTYPTCDKPGVGHYVEYCSRCDYSKPADTTVEIAATGHKDGETKVTYVAGDNTTVTEDGKVELKDKTKDGKYTKITTTYCSVCKEEIKDKTKKEELTVPATEVTALTKIIKTDEKGNIADSIENADPSDVKDEKLKLEDCTKDGFYWIVSLDKNKVEISRVKHTVTAHHVTKADYKEKDEKQKGMLNVIRDKDGNVTSVESKSCKESVEYYEIVTCSAENDKVISKTLKVAAPTGDHVLSAATETQLKDVAGKAEKKVALTAADIAKLKANKEIKVEIKDACEAEGTVTVTAYCNVCGKEVQSITAKVVKLGHDFGDAKDIVEENKVDSTCSKEGSYDTVHYCKVCGKREVVRTGIIIPKKAHSYGTKDNADQTTAFIRFTGNKVVECGYHSLTKGDTFNPEHYLYGFGVDADLAITCDTCGETEKTGNASLTVVDVQKETSARAGYVTLKATAEKTLKDGKKETIEKEYTVPYYTSMAAYLDRNPGKDAVNGLHEDNDHVFRYYVNSEFQADYAGIVEYNGGEFFVANGVLCSGANGLNEFGGKWYFLANGQIQRGYNGLALYDGEWFYLKNGELDATVKGLVDYDGGRFLFADGRLVKEHNGLWQDFDGTWYFLALGQVQDQFTGTTVYDGQTFKLENGKLVA